MGGRLEWLEGFQGSSSEALTVHSAGKLAASAALRAALRGDSTTEDGAHVPVHNPVMIASAMAPVPTKPSLLMASLLL